MSAKKKNQKNDAPDFEVMFEQMAKAGARAAIAKAVPRMAKAAAFVGPDGVRSTVGVFLYEVERLLAESFVRGAKEDNTDEAAAREEAREAMTNMVRNITGMLEMRLAEGKWPFGDGTKDAPDWKDAAAEGHERAQKPEEVEGVEDAPRLVVPAGGPLN